MIRRWFPLPLRICAISPIMSIVGQGDGRVPSHPAAGGGSRGAWGGRPQEPRRRSVRLQARAPPARESPTPPSTGDAGSAGGGAEAAAAVGREDPSQGAGEGAGWDRPSIVGGLSLDGGQPQPITQCEYVPMPIPLPVYCPCLCVTSERNRRCRKILLTVSGFQDRPCFVVLRDS